MTAAVPGGEAERLRLVRAALLAKAARCRRDPAEFFEFVMREETTREKLVTAPHQRVLFDFEVAHERCVLRLPTGFSKTTCTTSFGIWNLGLDSTERGIILSSSVEQAKKPLTLVRQYLDFDGGMPTPEIRWVFPRLRKSQREDDQWTQTKLTVDRPPGIRDASMTAVGYRSKLPGARLSWILADDLLDGENTRTKQQREELHAWLWSTVLARRDVAGAKFIFANTPWHPDDATYRLEKAGFPTLTMDAEGGIRITNTDWDTPDVRVAYKVQGAGASGAMSENVRLAAHDAEEYGAPLVRPRRGQEPRHFDYEEKIPLWPERWGSEQLAEKRAEYASAGRLRDYNSLFRMLTRSDEESRCKLAYVELCKLHAREVGYLEMPTEYAGSNPVATGVDLGIGQDADHDRTCFVTVELVPQLRVGKRTFRNVRRLLDVEAGRWPGGIIIDKLLEKQRKFGGVIRVETNAAQDFIRQWALERDASVPVRSHQTGKNKRSFDFGVETVFIELENGAWLLPNAADGSMAEDVQSLVDGCLEYRQGAHTADELMAMWLAREQLRDLAGFTDLGQQVDVGGDAGATLLAR